MKKFFGIVLLIFLLTSCNTNKEIIVNPNAVPFDIVTEVLMQYPDQIKVNAVLYSESEDELLRLDDYYATLYLGSGSEDIDLDKFESYCVVSVPAGSATEIGVLKVKNISDIDYIVSLVKMHFTRIAGNFSSYIEEEAEIARNAEVRTAGNFIYYVAAIEKDNIFSTMETILTSGTREKN
jgi:hypothetical protein